MEKQLDYLLKVLIDEKDEIIYIPNDFNSKKRLLRALMNIRPPKPIDDDYLKIQDLFLQSQNQVADTDFKSGLNVWQGDITTLNVDAIVNAANSKLLGCFHPLHNCIDNIIHSKAGVQLREECNEIMIRQGFDEHVGDAKITKAYNLPSKYVIHTVGPAISPNRLPTQEECKQLASCYRSCLNLADEHNLDSIAFCCISTGVFNFPQKKAAEIAVETVKNTPHNVDKVIFDTFLDSDFLIYNNLLGD
ncbi:MAG: protein-ADP-ribose hydrolase [Methanobrevibacter sp.]|uniref:protein-ADP-ribose hydrolase n=1 Tax=Methanobrevibacter sp. TaxID=66852 RepID=UPI0026E0F8F7|nr:protein-ADP-ribose hydrolase [Methanobrevibacter sp.]MDO5849449.1 protein-ADP-ribose hydrolase [Methanobrevibacter sp.]